MASNLDFDKANFAFVSGMITGAMLGAKTTCQNLKPIYESDKSKVERFDKIISYIDSSTEKIMLGVGSKPIEESIKDFYEILDQLLEVSSELESLILDCTKNKVLLIDSSWQGFNRVVCILPDGISFRALDYQKYTDIDSVELFDLYTPKYTSMLFEFIYGKIGDDRFLVFFRENYLQSVYFYHNFKLFAFNEETANIESLPKKLRQKIIFNIDLFS